MHSCKIHSLQAIPSENIIPTYCPRDFYLYIDFFILFPKAKHHIIGLLIDRCADPDKRTRKFACFAVSISDTSNDD